MKSHYEIVGAVSGTKYEITHDPEITALDIRLENGELQCLKELDREDGNNELDNFNVVECLNAIDRREELIRTGNSVL